MEHQLSTLLGNNKAAANPEQTKQRDKTKYLFNGGVFGKSQLVLAVVTHFVSEHKNITFEELANTFHKSLQGSLGVVQKHSFVLGKSDASKRWHMANPIALKNAQAVVCTQWGSFNIPLFLTRAKELGYQITEINNN